MKMVSARQLKALDNGSWLASPKFVIKWNEADWIVYNWKFTETPWKISAPEFEHSTKEFMEFLIGKTGKGRLVDLFC